MIRTLLIITLIGLLTGCASAAVVSKGAEANDAALEHAIWFKCRGASIGSILRRYGSNPSAWSRECLPQEDLF